MNTMLDYIRRYADTILNTYRDPYHGTPLFFDGMNTFTGEPVKWRNMEGTDWEPSNLASQQNLFRTLSALSALSGDGKYKQAAMDAIRWHFDHADASGLLTWGGHCFLDLKTLDTVGPEGKNKVHEIKHHYPFYELMFEVDPQATAKLIKAEWNCHIDNWDTLELTRHGSYGRPLPAAGFWDKPMHRDLEILREAKGLSFVNIGNDLIYGAGLLGQRVPGEEKALDWAEFMAWQYVRSRYPATGLGCYQFNRPVKREEAPSDENHPQFTYSFYGDRAQRQFGPEYGDVAQEAWVLFKMDPDAMNGPEGIYGDATLAQLTLARQLGAKGEQLKQWAVDGLDAWLRYAYVPETNQIKPMFADGKDLTGQVFPRRGFYGKKGWVFERKPINTIVFLSTVTAWAMTGRASLWQHVVAMARHFGLGEWHATDPAASKAPLVATQADAILLFAVLEVARATQAPAYLALAKSIGERIMAQHAHRGMFVPSEKHVHCRFDDTDALALLTLIATERGCPELVPGFRSQGGYIHGDIQIEDGSKKNILDIKDIYPQTMA